MDIKKMSKEMEEELVTNILPFWMNKMTDETNGEWHWSVRADGTINTEDDKAGFWKCPYHNGRMCMEVIERFS